MFRTNKMYDEIYKDYDRKHSDEYLKKIEQFTKRLDLRNEFLRHQNITTLKEKYNRTLAEMLKIRPEIIHKEPVFQGTTIYDLLEFEKQNIKDKYRKLMDRLDDHPIARD